MPQLEFLPVSLEDTRALGWQQVDFVLACGDAYVDHPSFGAALLGRVLQAAGWRVGMLPQPDVSDENAFKVFGRPRLAFLISGGVVDSMVAHYTSAKRRRGFDEYSPGGKTGLRPDRVIDTYSRCIRKAYGTVPIVVGGVEASLRRFAHYDYWSDSVLPSILESSGADVISFGMGERSLCQLADALAAGRAIKDISEVPGTAFLADADALPKSYVECASYARVKADKLAYARACRIQMDNQDPATAKPVVQKQTARYLVQLPPALPLDGPALDAVYELPFTRRWHPMYDATGGIPGLEEVEFSIAHNRGCFGGCNFCAITLHQGRRVTSRSAQSVVAEAKHLTGLPGFKGYIHDVGGPTANFRAPSCEQQAQKGMCSGGKKCLAPQPCPRLEVSHSGYLAMLRQIRALPGVKKVFIRSGIRYDYLIYDKDESFFKELVTHHVSGQLKVAPEHCSPEVLRAMGKPSITTYNRFAKRFYQLSKAAGKQQYLVPYLISGHPGSTLKDAVALAEYLHDNRLKPEQVQDFYPTPGTVSTCMYHTGLDPYTEKPVYVPKNPQEKAMQRALLQPRLPKNRALARQALVQAGRAELIPKLVGGTAAPGGVAVAGAVVAVRPAPARQGNGKKQFPKGKRAKDNTWRAERPNNGKKKKR